MRKSIGSLLVLLFLGGMLSAEDAVPVEREGRTKPSGPDREKAVRVEKGNASEKVLYLKNAEDSTEAYNREVEARKLRLERQRLENLIEKYRRENDQVRLREAQIALDKFLHPWKYRKSGERVIRIKSGNSFRAKKVTEKNTEESR